MPSILQMEALECGAASLAMVLAYYGKFVPLEKLRSECGVSRDGSAAVNIVQAARKYGLKAQGHRLKPESVKTVRLPMILFWNFNHFVVLTGIKGNKVFLNDPAAGPRVVSYNEFDQAFTGVVLAFEPEPDFRQGGEKFRALPALIERLQGAKIALTYIVLASLFLVIPGLIIPIFSKIFVDHILIDQMYGWMRPLLLAMALTALLRGLLTWLQQYYLLRLETKLALAWSARFLRHLLRLPIPFFFQRLAGDLGGRVQLNDAVARLLANDIATNALNVLTIVFFALLMAQYDLPLTLLGVAAALLNALTLRYVSRKQTLLNQKLHQETGKFMGILMSGLQMIETLKATGAESDFFTTCAGYQAKVINAQQEARRTSQTLAIIPSFLTGLIDVIVLIFGAYRVMQGHLSMGMLVAFQSLMRSFLTPVNQLMNVGLKIQQTTAGVQRLDDVFRYDVDESFQNGRQMTTDEARVDRLEGFLEFKQVTFGYSRLEPPLIQDLNFSLRPGDRVALVGKSGSGKSTVAKLITGLYHPWSGEILFDGRPRREYPRQFLNNSLAAVDQEIFLFEGAIKDNLTMWDDTAPDANVVWAAKDACIHDDIGNRPGAYRSEVAERGANFSGGQRQRLEIARALVNNPSILILDEATSALDPKTEKMIDDQLRQRGCTTLIIAHRLSTIRDADEIIVLDRGKVVQRGTHNELINVAGLYADLITEQSVITSAIRDFE